MGVFGVLFIAHNVCSFIRVTRVFFQCDLPDIGLCSALTVMYCSFLALLSVRRKKNF